MSRLNSLYFPDSPAQTRVVVAMSGGVDSSVVAGLLRREGYDVVGITLQLYDHGAARSRKGACCAGQDIHDARAVADQLGIPHYVLDYEQRFAGAVIGAFADSYAAGETPVPCIACNQKVKFHDLLATARELGAQALATGHYIASRPGASGFALYRAADAGRDQSYFLFATTREQLGFLRFPLGDLAKTEVRRLAGELGLSVAAKPDSQDICFVPEGGYARVVERLRPDAAEPGEIVHMDGRVLGTHQGIIRYTIGQRRGIGVAAGEPLFVVGLDARSRRVVVGPRAALAADRITVRDVNWLGDEPLEACGDAGHPLHVRIRSTGASQPARLVTGQGRCEVVLDEPAEGVSPGQACVFYANGSARARILGGGWIARARSVVDRLVEAGHPAPAA